MNMFSDLTNDYIRRNYEIIFCNTKKNGNCIQNIASVGNVHKKREREKERKREGAGGDGRLQNEGKNQVLRFCHAQTLFFYGSDFYMIWCCETFKGTVPKTKLICACAKHLQTCIFCIHNVHICNTKNIKNRRASQLNSNCFEYVIN